MIYAIYRCLYGQDFIQQSINSITDYVDKIFIFWDDTPWGDATECRYLGKTIKFPEKFDNILDKIKELNNPKIELIYDHVYNNINQFTHFVNDIILPKYDKPKELLIIEVDHIFRKDQIEKTLKEFRDNNYIHATTKQVEIWRGFNYRVPERNYRTGVVLWNLENLEELPDTGRQAQTNPIKILNSFVHNFGFAVSERSMYCKHLIALSMGRLDSLPNEKWYEDKWLSWDFETNNENLEISKNFSHLIPKVIPYNIEELPEIIRESMKIDKEHKFTSTGIKFWCHPDKMKSYLNSTGKSVISTHISPEGRCNLNCSYCSVKKRNKFYRIDFDVIKDYINKLCSRGLKAVILTGGGEPTLYPEFNELVEWLKYDRNLSIGLITNGTSFDIINVWDAFSWVRISLNTSDIFVPKDKLNKDCVLGCSLVYTEQSIYDFIKVAKLARDIGAEYIRVLPDCLNKKNILTAQHIYIERILSQLNDPLFFHQFKLHRTPISEICHQAYFRPYLSEVEGGTMYPCDSLVLNDTLEKFDKRYQICKAKDILRFLDGDIKMKFDPRISCNKCVFTNTIDMLDKWKKTGCKEIEFSDDLIHKEFV